MSEIAKTFSFVGAPMHGVMDSPARKMIRKFSKKNLLYTQMWHAAFLTSKKSDRFIAYDPIEHPLAFQISTNSTKFLEESIEKVIEKKFCEINLNSGCPAKNIIKSGSGSFLMSKPKVLEQILKTIEKTISGRLPFTLKIRAGFKEKNGLEIAKMAEACGITRLIVHPRTQTGGFSAPLDFELIREIRKSLSIPIVFSGNITSLEDALETHEKTGVTEFMVGRALWGAPWKLKEIESEIAGKEFVISTKEIIACAIEHLDLCIGRYGPGGINPFKAHLAKYFKGLPNSAALRSELLVMLEHNQMKARLVELASTTSSVRPE